MIEWVKGWLEEQRRAGKKCLEIKMIQNKPYVYHSTSRYDPETKKPKKYQNILADWTKSMVLFEKKIEFL